VIDSQVVGRWRRTIGRSGVAIETDLLVPLDDAAHAALQCAINRYTAFLNRA
jgi:hypothetical protein